jgi:hypothetical protein
VNYSILDNTSEFMDKKIRDSIHKLIDKMVEDDIKSSIVKLHKSLKNLKKKLGWISEVKFLTFGAMLILASRGIDASYLSEALQILGSASLASGAIGVVARILEEGIKIYPGFSIYASFINWPKIS